MCLPIMNVVWVSLLVNSCHPDPGRVWKGGSDLPGLRSLCVDCADPVDNSTLFLPHQILCAGVVLEPYLSKPSRPPFKSESLKSRVVHMRNTNISTCETQIWWNVTEIVKLKVAEILIFGISEASGLRGLIRLVKLVSMLPARAHNISYGAQIYIYIYIYIYIII